MAKDLQAVKLFLQIEGRSVLDGVNHRFQAGTITLILGRSGSGKTMLLEALSGLRDIEGEVIIGTSKLCKDNNIQSQTMLMLGTGFQHPEQHLFALTVEAEFN